MTENLAQDFEKLGLFYLGRRFDLARHQSTQDLVLYDSRDLLTHAVCIGMTGSGKTGLCLSLVEEAAIDGIPVIAIDPKGDLSNLLLTFPDLSPEQFQPWVSADEARLKAISLEDFAKQQAQAWRQGLSEWGQSPDRIKMLRQAADFKVYTPGSTAGLPISIVQSLAAPEAEVIEDVDAFRELITTTANCLLALLGSTADPLKSREHILLSNILDKAWRNHQNLTLPDIIQQIQKPPMSQVGAIDIESFFPAKDRFELAMTVNNLLAAPGFDAWLTGQPLDINKLLYSKDGKPQVSIFSIAHLGETERMFFVTLLLSQILSWVRSQPGTSSLRALLYMDEIFGYFPPIANPPSKLPLLTLLKQARAYGLGLLLATQNPVDLDYKGLANTGTWFIGRLQTERDKMRVLEGLEGAAAESGSKFDRQDMEKILAGLGQRIFLMNNVHDRAPEIFQSRWTLSYLRGPLTKVQIKTLMEPVKKAIQSAPETNQKDGTLSHPAASTSQHSGKRPALAPGIKQYFLSTARPLAEGEKLVYKPMLFASTSVRFVDTKTGIDDTVEKNFVSKVTGDGAMHTWSDAQVVKYREEDFQVEPLLNAAFDELPSGLAQAQNYKTWDKDLLNWLCQNQKFYLLYSASLNLYSTEGESEGAFRVRLQQRSNELRDAGTEKLRAKYASKLNNLQERIRIAQQKLERETQASRQNEVQSAISVGATILGAIVSRRPLGSGTLNKASSAARGIGRVSKKKQDVAQAGETLQSLQGQLMEMEQQFRTETATLHEQIKTRLETLQTVSITPKKTNVNISTIALLWVPFAQSSTGSTSPIW